MAGNRNNQNPSNLTQAQLEAINRLFQQQNELRREGLSLEEQRKEIIRESLAIEKDIAKSGQNYLDHMKSLKKLIKEIKRVESQIQESKKIVEKLEKKIANTTGREQELNKQLLNDELIRLDILEKRLKLEQQSAEATKIALKNSSKLGGFYKQSVNDLKAIKSAWGSISSFVGGFSDVFKWEKSIKMTAMNMGVLSSRFGGFQKNMVKAATTTAQWGMDITEVTKIQGSYSEELGRAVMLTDKGAARLGAMAQVTGLGAEGAGKMAGELGKVGLSAERTANYVEQTLNDSSKMGLNSAKVIKNISSNLKLLNRYNFKGGTKSLAKMAQYATKMGVSMNLAGAMADKLMDVEGAVEMSSQLQVLGGEWSKIADPFKLMYMARNDMEGLTKTIVGATKNLSQFNSKTKEFDISAQGMAQLREVAKITGVEFEELATAAKKAANYAKINKQIGIGFKDKDTREFIENTATFDEKGQAHIMIDGEDKLVKSLNMGDKQALQRAIKEKATMEERAKQARSLDELWKNTVIMLKQLLVPVVDAINKKLSPVMGDMLKKLTDPKFIDGIIEFGKKVGDIIGTIGKFMIEHPVWSVALFGIFEAAKWVLNGMQLGLGFNMTARVGGGIPGVGGAGGKGGGGLAATLFGAKNTKALGLGTRALRAGNMARGGSLLARGAAGVGGRFAVAGALKDQFDFFSSKSARGTGFSGWLESLGGSGMSLLDWIPGVNQLVEATGLSIDNMGTDNVAMARAVYRRLHPDSPTVIPNSDLINDIRANPDLYPDDVVEDASDVKINDGLISFNAKDKFMKVNDGTMIAGTDAGGNRALANAMKPGNNVHHKFDNDLKVDGRIELVTNGEIISKIGKELLQSASFVRDLTNHINKVNLSYAKG